MASHELYGQTLRSSKACSELVKCSCRSVKGCGARCSCKKANWKCAELCKMQLYEIIFLYFRVFKFRNIVTM